MSRTFKYWLPVLVWMGVIFLVSTDLGSANHTSRIIEPLLRWVVPDISASAVDTAQTVIRKGGHLTEYAILALLSLRAIVLSAQSQSGHRYFRHAVIALVIAAAYAASDEFHQSFIPSRTPSVYDVMIDTTGAAVALTVATLWKKGRAKSVVTRWT